MVRERRIMNFAPSDVISDYSTLEEAAARWRISERQLRQLRAEGHLPQPISRGSLKMYTRAQILFVLDRDHILAGFRE